jgi:hypothetical protein
MKLAVAKLQSTSAYSQSKIHEEPKQRSESHDDYERRTWRSRLHVDEETGNVFIPPMAFKNCMSEAAKYLGMQIPGKGKATFKAKFESGLFVSDPLILPISHGDVQFERLFVPSDGMRGGTKRVWKHFPIIPEWSGIVNFYVLDEILNEDVFREHLKWAGQIIGIGRFRPSKNGFYGRFKLESLDWQDVTI